MAWPTGVEWVIFMSGFGFTAALLPQLVRTVRLGRANDFSLPFILIVVAASITALVYFLLVDVRGWFVYYGYVANILVWLVVAWYRLFPRPRSYDTDGGPGSNVY
jgi:uncharacterized protein with PQ loop repeat